MRIKLPPTAVVSAIAALLASCLDDGHQQTAIIGQQPVRFSTTISTTRARDNVWEPGDRIGVYMITADAPEWNETTVPGNNAQYAHGMEQESGKATFSGVGAEALFWPEEGGKVDFTAYYPYREDGIEDYIVPVDVADQSTPKDIDLMTAELNDMSAAGGNPPLTFYHRLSRLRFNITDQEGELTGMSASLSGLPTNGGYDLTSGTLTIDDEGAGEPFEVVATATSATKGAVTAIVLPGDDFDYRLTIELAGGERAVFRVNGADFDPGTQYIYNITLVPGEVEPVEIGFGGLTGITGWGEGDGPGDYNPELPKEPEPGKKGAPWFSEPLKQSPDEPGAYSFGGNYGFDNGLTVSSPNMATIAKNNYNEGIAAVSISAGSYGFGGKGSLSVTVGDTEMVCGDGTSETLATIQENLTDYLFLAPDGGTTSGTVTITIDEVKNGSVIVSSFTINP